MQYPLGPVTFKITIEVKQDHKLQISLQKEDKVTNQFSMPKKNIPSFKKQKDCENFKTVVTSIDKITLRSI